MRTTRCSRHLGLVAVFAVLTAGCGTLPRASAGPVPSTVVPPTTTASAPASVGARTALAASTRPWQTVRRKTWKVKGAKSRFTGDVIVVLPPSYLTAAGRHRTYPVIQTFQGIPGEVDQWVGQMNLPGVLDARRRAGRIGEAIIVAALSQPLRGPDLECVNTDKRHPAMETFLGVDVPAWVQAHYRVTRTAGSWATAGFSAGGWCAAMIAMLHPTRYGAAIAMSAYFQPWFEPDFVPFAPNSSLGRRYDLVALAHSRPPKVRVWLTTSRADGESWPTASALAGAARKPFVVTSVVLRGWDHDWSVWKAMEPKALDWLGKALPSFAPRR